MSAYYEQASEVASSLSFLKKKTLRIHKSILGEFRKHIFSFSLFKLIFFLLFVAQISALFFFYDNISFLAIQLGAILLTVFTYLVLFFYLQARKPELMVDLRNRFVTSCRRSIAIPLGTAEHHLLIAQYILQFVGHLYHLEHRIFMHKRFRRFSKWMRALEVYFHSEDFFKMKELFYCAAIDEHIAQIRLTPSDLEVHASLAHAFSSMARMYLDIKQTYENKNRRALKKYENYLDQRFEFSSLRAIEELRILNDYAPNDPWVHAQLALSYHSLEKYEEEAKEYETILSFNPRDQEVKFQLARLYFELGKNAQGLKLYEELKQNGLKNAETLLKFYRSSQLAELFEEF